MDEPTWLSCIDREPMLHHIANQASSRKLRLFGWACLRQAWDWTDHAGFHRAVLAGERFVEGVISETDLRRTFIGAWPQGWEPLRTAAICTLTAREEWQLRQVRILAYEVERLSDHLRQAKKGKKPPERAILGRAHAAFLREIFGNPFRRTVFAPHWRTPDVLALAGEALDERCFAHLPILADALEDAGCTDSDLIAHLREPGEHLPGCWALDLALGQD